MTQVTFRSWTVSLHVPLWFQSPGSSRTGVSFRALSAEVPGPFVLGILFVCMFLLLFVCFCMFVCSCYLMYVFNMFVVLRQGFSQ